MPHQEAAKALSTLSTMLAKLDPNIEIGQQTLRIMTSTVKDLETFFEETALIAENLPSIATPIATHIMTTKEGTIAWFHEVAPHRYQLVKATGLINIFTPYDSTSEASYNKHKGILDLIITVSDFNTVTARYDYDGGINEVYAASTIASVIARRTVNGRDTIRTL